METQKKKLTIPSEIVYVISIILMAFSVAMLTAVNFGISMIVAPAYILSRKFDFLTFGLAEYVVQSVVLIIFFITIRRFRPVYLTSFITCILYGIVLDLFRNIIPAFNPEITPAGSFPVYLKVILFIAGMTLTSFSVALSFKTYLYPQVYDLFVKGVSERYSLGKGAFKTLFDFSFLMIAIILSYALLKDLEGVGIGTLIMAVANGTLIGLSSKLLDKFVEVKPLFPKMHDYFERF